MPKKKLKLPNHISDKDLKKEIQRLIREISILRDGGCVLRDYPETGSCGWFRNDGELILQAEHLSTRSNSISYGDMRNIVCLCAHHHLHYKPQHSKRYWELIRKVIGEDRWNWFERVEADGRPYKMDWRLVILDLKQQLRKLKEASIEAS